MNPTIPSHKYDELYYNLPAFNYVPWASGQPRIFKRGTILSPWTGCFWSIINPFQVNTLLVGLFPKVYTNTITQYRHNTVGVIHLGYIISFIVRLYCYYIIIEGDYSPSFKLVKHE
jgi:hypothetical protein